MRQLLILKLIIVFIAVSISSNVMAAGAFYKDKYRGWLWYEDPIKKEDSDAELFKKPRTPEEAAEQIAAIRMAMDKYKAYAVLNHDPKSTARYVKMQQYVLNISEKFTNSWQDALRLYPDLDESIKNPVSGQAKDIMMLARATEDNATLREFSSKYGLILLARNDCPYCHAFIPVVEEFAKNYDFTLLAAAQDGSDIKGLNATTKQTCNADLIASLPAEYVPALFAVQPETGEVVMIASGFVAMDELLKRAIRAYEFKKGKYNVQ